MRESKGAGVAGSERIMLFNTQSTGHHAEHVQHLLRHCEELRPSARLIPVVPPEMAENIQDDVERARAQIEVLDGDEVQHVHSQQSRWRRSLAEWTLAETYARRLGVDHCVLLDLNWFQFALGFSSAHDIPFTLSGIYFFPFVRLTPREHSGIEYVRQGARYVRKWVVAGWMMRNPKIESVFVLNDPTAAEWLNERVDSSARRVESLPDPVFALENGETAGAFRETYELDLDRHAFLFAGTISRRKGVIQALEAFQKLEADEQRRCSLVLAGRLVDEVADDVMLRVEHLRQKTEVEVRTEFRFLSDAELRQALAGCDAILAPYQRTEGSSGLLGHAAQVQSPVIGPRRGLIGELIDRYELGMTVDATRNEDVARALRVAVIEGIRIGDRSKEYTRDRTPKRFAEYILCGDLVVG